MLFKCSYLLPHLFLCDRKSTHTSRRNKGNWVCVGCPEAWKNTCYAFKVAHFPFSGPVSTRCHPDHASFFTKSIDVLETRLSQSLQIQTEADILALLCLRLSLSPSTLLPLILLHPPSSILPLLYPLPPALLPISLLLPPPPSTISILMKWLDFFFGCMIGFTFSVTGRLFFDCN